MIWAILQSRATRIKPNSVCDAIALCFYPFYRWAGLDENVIFLVWMAG
jgi:hypothetical protein